MPTFLDWLTRVLTRGESVQDVPPVLPPRERPAVEQLLRDTFAEHLLDVPVPPIPFDSMAAIGSAEVLAQACWCLVGGEGESVSLTIDSESSSPSAHLSIDVALRFLPAVHRRATDRTTIRTRRSTR